MKRHTILVGVALSGCAGADDLGAELPGVAALTLAAPAATPVDEPAAIWSVTRRAVDDLNRQVASVVGPIDRILHTPPAARDEDGAVWGPIAAPLDPLIYRLVARRSDGGVSYHLDAWPRTSAGDAAPIVWGTAGPDGGRVAADLARIRALDPTADVGGAAGFVAEYRPDGIALGVDEAHYRYAREADGGGALELTDPELGALRSRWLPTGAGRGETSAGVVECWDDGFRRTFIAGPDGVAGDPAACPDVR